MIFYRILIFLRIVILACYKRKKSKFLDGFAPYPYGILRHQAAILHALGTCERCAHIFSVLSPALWTSFETNLWFNVCFKFLKWMANSVLSCKLAISFSIFSIFILSSKNGKSLWTLFNFPVYLTSTSIKSLYSFLWNFY